MDETSKMQSLKSSASHNPRGKTLSAKESENSQKENIALLANDINNQLSGIIGNAELLKRDGLEPYEKSQLICNIVACARQTTYLTDKIIAIEGNLPIPKKPEAKKIFPKSEFNTVLVIDDEDVIRKVAKSILQSAGYDVIIADSGKEGIEQYKKYSREIMCVLLDLTMPYLPGNLVYAKLKAIDPSVKVFLMSGLSMPQVMQQFESEDIAGFIKKPFMMDELLEIIGSARQLEVH